MSGLMESSFNSIKVKMVKNHSLIVTIILSVLMLSAGCRQSDSSTQMQAEANKAVVMQAWEECFNQGKTEMIKEVFDTNYVESSPYRTFEPRGIERVKEADEWMKSVFDSLHFEIEQMIAEGDYVFSRAMATGVHIGEFAGVKATHKPVRFAVVVVSKVSDGKIVQDWSFVDRMQILKQIGNVTVTPKD